MFTVSFRVYLNTLAGQKVFLNGAASSSKRIAAGTRIVVKEKAQSYPDDAEVIQSVGTARAPEDYAWEIV